GHRQLPALASGGRELRLVHAARPHDVAARRKLDRRRGAKYRQTTSPDILIARTGEDRPRWQTISSSARETDREFRRKDAWWSSRTSWWIVVGDRSSLPE